MKQLVDVLRGAGMDPVTIGDKVVILPFSGRAIGLFPTPNVNVLWINAALDSVDTAKAMFAADGWINSGGIRAWISPECETHVSDPGRFWETYDVPATVDPGKYAVEASNDNSVSLDITMEPMFYRHQGKVPLRMRRTIRLLEEADVTVPDEVAYAGIEISSTFAFDGDSPNGVRPGLWNLVQVPRGGEIRVPVKKEAKPVTMFGDPVLSFEDGVIGVQVETGANFKISLHADDCRGVMSYLKSDGDHSTLIVLRLPVLDQSLYADTPASDLNDTGHAQQVYIDDGAMGGFGELEYHTPTLEKGIRDEIEDRGDVRTFCGPAEALEDLRARYLQGQGVQDSMTDSGSGGQRSNR